MQRLSSTIDRTRQPAGVVLFAELILLGVVLCVVPARARADCAQTLTQRVGGYVNVGRHVDCAAVLEAVDAMPPGARARLRRTRLVRLPDAPQPDLSLAARILGRLIPVAYHPLSRSIIVTDAGATGSPAWVAGAVEPADAVDLLNGLGPWLDGATSPDARWARLWERVGGSGPVPPLGSPEVLDRLVVWLAAQVPAWSRSEPHLALALWTAALSPRGASDVALSEGAAQSAGVCPCAELPGTCFEGECDLAARSIRQAGARSPVEQLLSLAKTGELHDRAGELARIARLAARGPEHVSGEAAVDVFRVLLPEQLMAPEWQQWYGASAAAIVSAAEPEVTGRLRRLVASGVEVPEGVLLDQPAARIPADLPAPVRDAFDPGAFELRVGDRILRPPPARVEARLRRAQRRFEAALLRDPPQLAEAAVTAALSGDGNARRLAGRATAALAGRPAWEHDHAAVWLARAQAHLGRVARALSLARQAVKTDGGPARRLNTTLAIADIALNRADYSGASKALEEAEIALRDVPAEAREPALLQLVLLQASLGRHDRAAELLEQLQGAAPAGLLAQLADWRSAEGAHAAARALAEQAAAGLSREASPSAEQAVRVARALARTAPVERQVHFAGELPLSARLHVLETLTATRGPVPALETAIGAVRARDVQALLWAGYIAGLMTSTADNGGAVKTDDLVDRLLRRALLVGKGAASSPIRARALDRLSRIQLRRGDRRGAELTAWALDPRYLDHSDALPDVVEAYVAAGNRGEAARVAGLIRLDEVREQTLRVVFAMPR